MFTWLLFVLLLNKTLVTFTSVCHMIVHNVQTETQLQQVGKLRNFDPVLVALWEGKVCA